MHGVLNSLNNQNLYSCNNEALYLKIYRKLINSNMDFLLEIYEVYDENNNIGLVVNINIPPSVKLTDNIKRVIRYLSRMTYNKIQTTLINDRDGLYNEKNWDNLYNDLLSLEEIQLHRMIADDKIEGEIMRNLIQDDDLLRCLISGSTIQDLVEHKTIKQGTAKNIIEHFNYLLGNDNNKHRRKKHYDIDSDDFMRVLCAYLFYTVVADKKKKNALTAKYYWKRGSAMLEIMDRLKEQYPVGHDKLVSNYENSVLYTPYEERGKMKVKERK